MRKLFFAAIVSSLLFVGNAVAQQVQVTIENLQPAGSGFYLTPVWLGVHDGSFDLYNLGEAASISMQNLAEEGITSGIMADFSSNGVGQQSVITNASGFPMAPVLDPGESGSAVFTLGPDSRFLSYATMIIPTNDSFFANDDPTGLELLDASGTFTGDRVIEFGIEDLYDAGSELNDTMGAAFSAAGGDDTETTGFVTEGPDISNFNGIPTAAGTTINFDEAVTAPVLRITISSVAVPEPSSTSVLGLATLGCLLRRRRK
ncbi:spondin domain-containing protein [Mariniblastus sp.]|nr:spondin domain-containing protein [Mariniblastus sp.]